MPTAMTYFAVGSSVVLQNLVNASKYNGQRGTVQSILDAKSLRQNVLLVSGGVHLSVKPANMKMFNDGVMTMSIKELVAELTDYNISTNTIKDKQSLQEAAIAARKDGWVRPSTKVTAFKSPPPAAAAASASVPTAASPAASGECHVGNFSSGYKRAAPSSKNKPSSKKTKSSDASTQKSLPELALAKKWDENMNVKGYYMSEKLDGMRCLWDGTNLYSRNHNLIHAPGFFTQNLPKGIALDGELFVGRGEFQECMSIVKQTRPDEHDWKRVTFCVFDAPTCEGDFGTRLRAAKDALSKTDTSIAKVLPQIECRGKAHVLEEFARIREQNGEGIILRKANAPYRKGRTSDLLKYKEFLDAEARVIGYQDGKGKHSGRMGALICEMLDYYDAL